MDIEGSPLNNIGFEGRSVPEISLINEDIPPREHFSYSSNNGSDFHRELFSHNLNNGFSHAANGTDSNMPIFHPTNGEVDRQLFNSNDKQSYNQRDIENSRFSQLTSTNGSSFLPLSNSPRHHQESPANKKLENFQLDLVTLCRKNDDILMIIKEQQSMIRELNHTVAKMENAVQGLQSQLANTEHVRQIIQKSAADMQNIPRIRELRCMVKELLQEENESICKLFKDSVISVSKTTCNKEVQVNPDVQEQAVQCQVARVAYPRENICQTGDDNLQRDTLSPRFVDQEPLREQDSPVESRQPVTRAGVGPLAIQRFDNRREYIPERIVEGQYTNRGDAVKGTRRPTNEGEVRYVDAIRSRNPLERSPVNHGYAGPPVPILTDNRSERELRKYRQAPVMNRLLDHELNYYPERASPGPVTDNHYYEGGETNFTSRRVDRLGHLRNEYVARNSPRDVPIRSEDSMVANQFVAKYLGAERLNQLQRPPSRPPPPPHSRKTILTGNVSFAQFAVEAQFPNEDTNRKYREAPRPPVYVASRGRYGSPPPEDDDYDSWDDMPQGDPVPPSERILDLTAIYNQPPG